MKRVRYRVFVRANDISSMIDKILSSPLIWKMFRWIVTLRRCLLSIILYRVHPRRLKKLLTLAIMAGFVLIASFVVLDVTQRIIRSRIAEYQRQTRVLNPEILHRQKYDVILSAYMNSGSTFTGRFLGFRSDSFYFYEPLWHLNVWNYFRDNVTVCSSRLAVCRSIKSEEANKNSRPIVGPGRHLDLKILNDPNITAESDPILVPQTILDHVFNCRLQKLANIIEPGVTSEVKFAASKWSSFTNCLYKRFKIDACLKDLTEICKTVNHRVSKVLRMSVQGLEPILRDNPRLKVIHLFRDPRAIIHSRIETSGYPLRFSLRGSPEIRSNAKALCDKMASDIEEGKRLMMKYPDRFRFVHYEDIYSNESSLIKLHNFLGMVVTRGELNYIRTVENLNHPSRSIYERGEQRQNNNAYWWTRYLKWGIVQTLDKPCLKVYKSLGYPILRNEGDLVDLNFDELLSNLAFKL